MNEQRLRKLGFFGPEKTREGENTTGSFVFKKHLVVVLRDMV